MQNEKNINSVTVFWLFPLAITLILNKHTAFSCCPSTTISTYTEFQMLQLKLKKQTKPKETPAHTPPTPLPAKKLKYHYKNTTTNYRIGKT